MSVWQMDIITIFIFHLIIIYGYFVLNFSVPSCRMWPADEQPWKHSFRSDHSNQPVGSEPAGERGSHPVPAQPVSVPVWDNRTGQHGGLSKHGEDQ